jgi:uncharacterized protein (TIGR02270 family)
METHSKGALTAGQHSVSIPSVLRQYADDAAALHAVRAAVVNSAHARLKDIAGFDNRVAAHIDGLLLAGERAWPFLEAALASPSCGAVFAATVVALDGKEEARLTRMYALAEAVPDAQHGMVAAFGWVDGTKLRGTVSGLLASPTPFLRTLGIAACSLHRVDAGKMREAALESPILTLRNRALRMTAELGSLDSIGACTALLSSDDHATRFWAAWAAVLLGNRGVALETLKSIGEVPGPFQRRAFYLALQALERQDAQALLRELSKNPENLRLVVEGCGLLGDPHYVPWLIEQMHNPEMSRLAGEAFCLTVGVELVRFNLDRQPPGDIESRPNDDPNDPDVAIEAESGLPWPDQQGVADWWQANSGQFDDGTRYFLGRPVTRENCLRVLKEGFQRQRILAAHYLCLLEPGTTLFEWRAPAWRQKRLLAAME